VLSWDTDYDDLVQGGDDDCWLIESFAAVAWAAPFSNQQLPLFETYWNAVSEFSSYSFSPTEY